MYSVNPSSSARPEGNQRSSMQVLACTYLLLAPICGCTLFAGSNQALSLADVELNSVFGKSAEKSGSRDASVDSQVANPPAKSIRFDGNEVLLGSADSSELSLDAFTNEITKLVEAKKFYSASRFVDRHHRAAERYLWQAWSRADRVETSHTATQQLLSDALSKNLRADASWLGLFDLAYQQPLAANAYRQARSDYVMHLKDGDASDDSLDAKLQSAAQALGHNIVVCDALQLLAARQTLVSSPAWAESLYRQAAELCVAVGDDSRAADLMLLACAASERARPGVPVKNTDNSHTSQTTWQTAINTHIRWQLAQEVPIDTHFWISADSARPVGAAWPRSILDAMSEAVQELGCTLPSGASPEFSLWAGVAFSQYERNEPQIALVNFKKAETLTTGENQIWLRIAQSRCLAALGQTAASAAILSGPATSTNTAIACSARAALGSAKLQSGAYQQGAQLLNRAITESAGTPWPSKRDAQADLALALAILGETDQALTALHAVQRSYERAGNRIGLLASLENELRLLEHEHRTDEQQQVEKKIASIQRSSS